jgi:hypothetical protein
VCPDGFRWSTLNTIKEMIEREIGVVALDLREVTLVDRDVVNFLAACELKGIELGNYPAFLSEWIAKEKLQIAVEPPNRES